MRQNSLALECQNRQRHVHTRTHTHTHTHTHTKPHPPTPWKHLHISWKHIHLCLGNTSTYVLEPHPPTPWKYPPMSWNQVHLLLAHYPPSPSLQKGGVSACCSMWAALLEREGNLETLGYFWGNMKDFSKFSLNDWFPQET